MSDPADHQRLFKNARREMVLVLFVTGLALLWTVGYCYLNGYQHAEDSWVVQAGLAASRTPEDFQQIAGLPDWVLVGIILPWMVCTALGIGLGLGLKDDDLGSDAADADAPPHPPLGKGGQGGVGTGQEAPDGH